MPDLSIQSPPAIGDYVRPLGYSYTLGQGRLHLEDQAQGDYHKAYQDVDFVTDIFGGGFGMEGGVFNLQAIIAQLSGNGPIPKDVETTQVQGTYDAKDISLERHVYFYDYASHVPHKPEDLRLCLNLSGYSPSNNKWFVPSDKGVKIPYYALKRGTTLAQGQWEYPIGLDTWGADVGNQAIYKSVINTVVSIIGQSYGSDLSGLASVAANFAIAAVNDLPAIAAMVQAGRGDDLLRLLGEVVGNLIVDTLTNTHVADDFKNMIRNIPGGGNLGDYLATAGKTVNNIVSKADVTIDSIVNTSKGYAGDILSQVQNGIQGTPDDVLKQIATTRDVTDLDLVDIAKGGSKDSLLAQMDGLIGKQAINTTRSLLANDDPTSFIQTPAAYFFDLAAKAATSDDLINNIGLVPDYANHFYVMGATLRAAQLAALEDPIFRKYTAVKVPRPGGGLAGTSFMTYSGYGSQVNIMAQ